MYKINLLKFALAISLASLMFVGCSDDSSADNNTQETAYAVSGLIVDPYIEGAVLCEDVNINALCESTEQLSSASTAEGVFKFDNNLTEGSHVIIKTQGKHEGKSYDLNISGVVTSDGSIDVVSPLTTFETKGLSATQIAEILNYAAGVANISGWSISASDITANPLAAGIADKTISELSDTNLVNIQASLASYGILKIMSGSDALSALSSTELYYSGMNQLGHSELHEIAKAMLQGITSTLNSTTLTSVKSGIDQGRDALVSSSIPQATANAGLPEPTTNLVIKVAVSIIDRLAEIGYTTCNSTDGNVTAALNEVASNETVITNKAVDLGTQLYGFTYHDNMKNEFTGVYSAALSGIFSAQPNIEAGYNANENGYSTIRFDSSNSLVAQ